jgi:DNA-binding NarL/FixJ family response regulator
MEKLVDTEGEPRVELHTTGEPSAEASPHGNATAATDKAPNERRLKITGTVPEEMVDLTKREQEIYRLMVQGLTNGDIASELNIRDKTVRNHVHRIYDIIGVHNRTQAVLWGMEHGIG